MSDSTHDDGVPPYTPEMLRTVRKRELGLSMEDLSRKLGYAYATIQRYETGEATITPEYIAVFEKFRKQERERRAREGLDLPPDPGNTPVDPGEVVIELVPKRPIVGRLKRIFATVEPPPAAPTSPQGDAPGPEAPPVGPAPSPEPKQGADSEPASASPARSVYDRERMASAPLPAASAPASPAESARWRAQKNELRAIAACFLLLNMGAVLFLRNEIRAAHQARTATRSARAAPAAQCTARTEAASPWAVPGAEAAQAGFGWNAPMEGSGLGSPLAGRAKPPVQSKPMPKAPNPGQKSAPCSRRNGEIEVNKLCWWPLSSPECPDWAVLYEGRCLVAVPAPPSPTSERAASALGLAAIALVLALGIAWLKATRSR